MYPRAFRYYRAESLSSAVEILSDLGEDARLLAGGQSLIPLMKLRLASPGHLVDLGFIPGLSYVREEKGRLLFGPMTRHAEIEDSALVRKVPILHDCAAGIADVQVRNRGTLGGSLAEADPTGDWAPVLLTLDTDMQCESPVGERKIALPDLTKDAFTTVLAPDELISEIAVTLPSGRTGGAYMAVKRSAPVYASASAAVQLTMNDDSHCKEARIALGAVGLMAIRATEAEGQLRGQTVTAKSIAAAAEAAMQAADPQSDMRGSADYKRTLIRTLVARALDAALRRSRGQSVEVGHFYA